MMEVIDLTGDRISGLPDPILTHILSFIPTEEAVRTCILSKRWIKVWTCLPVLVLDDHTTQYDGLTQEEYQQREIKFLRFLSGIMFNREMITLDTFKLDWCVNGWDTHIIVCRFLCYAVMCRPRILSIHIESSRYFTLPDSIFTCTSIEEMSLWLETNDIFHKDNFLKPISINLPFLKNLELGYMDLNDDIMTMLISGCPVLEELALIHCWLKLSMISSNVLNKLVLTNCYQCGPMEISCPGVVSLSVTSINVGGITLKNMSSLATADIIFLDQGSTSNYDLRLLSGLSNVTSLKLQITCPAVMDLLLADIPNCPTLKNLKSLELGGLDFNYDWNLAACLLQHSSNLKDLILLFHPPTEEEFQGGIAFRHEYLEAVKISCPGKKVKLVKELVDFYTTAEISIL
ncbi:F-box protein At4g22280-like isoform X2 [Carex rostrata]